MKNNDKIDYRGERMTGLCSRDLLVISLTVMGVVDYFWW